MNDQIVKSLNNLMKDSNTLYVLKGFNFTGLFDISLKHIFNIGICDNPENLLKIDSKKFMTDNLPLLMSKDSFYCYYEELFVWEQENLFGIIKNYDYKIVVIDIGCFDYYYPQFKSENTNRIIDRFNEDSSTKNMYQIVYSEYDQIDDIPFICYNKLDNDDSLEYIRLFRTYNDEYIHYDHSEEKCIEMLDNCSPMKLVEIFDKFTKDEVNCIKYVSIENKNDNIIRKFLYLLNQYGCNITKYKEEKKFETPELIDEYAKILKRKNPSYDFREFKIYKDPFESNELMDVNQSYIIDYIYNNIINAQAGKDFRDIFVTAPTGAGKSVLFQIPAIMAAEKDNLVTLVISPLIGLMNDQVENIKSMTKAAVTINSEYTPYEKDQIKEGLKEGKYSILYVSPETLLSNYDVKSIIGERKIGLLVIDEAHTVATWGKNFRPDYWYLGEFLDRLRHRLDYTFPIATFTATSTVSNGIDDMYHDIVESLNMVCDPFVGDVKRKNIKFDIKLRTKDHAYKEEKDRVVLEKINDLVKSGERSLVYFPFVSTLTDIYSQSDTEHVSEYFGELDKMIKNSALQDLRSGKRNVCLATKAFGMGIDVDHILNVYHFAPTGNLADYVQEIGRAARKPEETGYASTDYYKEDFKYINKLYGLSQINDYHIKGVLQKILDKYRIENKRNFLISSEDFSHIFNATNDEEIDSNLKATIIAIKRDFKYTEHFVPLIFKPRSMYTKGLFYIADSQMIKARNNGWDKYLEKKYSGEDLSRMSYDECKTTYMGNVYEFDFKKCWLDQYNDRMTGITFGNFKRQFYENDLQDSKDRSFMLDKMILKVETKRNVSLNDIKDVGLVKLSLLKKMFESMKQSGRHYSLSDITDLYCSLDNKSDKEHIKSIIEPLVNLLINFNVRGNANKFCDFNSVTGKYCVKNVGYEKKIYTIKKAIENYVIGFEQETNRTIVVDGKNNVSREDPIVIAVQILEMFDLINYNFQAGNKPEFFVRVNSETAIRRILNNPTYHSRTLKSISDMHYNSIKYMTYFFTELNNDIDRWNFIEDYFLGNIDRNDKWNIKSIKTTGDESIEKQTIQIYNIYDFEDDRVYKYYISYDSIGGLNEEIYNNIAPDTELAKKILETEKGKIIEINDYKYRIDTIDFVEL